MFVLSPPCRDIHWLVQGPVGHPWGTSTAAAIYTEGKQAPARAGTTATVPSTVTALQRCSSGRVTAGAEGSASTRRRHAKHGSLALAATVWLGPMWHC